MAFAGNYSLNDWCFYVNSLDINHSCSNGSGTDNFVAPDFIPVPSIIFISTDQQHLGHGHCHASGKANITSSLFFDYDIALAGGLNEYATAVR